MKPSRIHRGPEPAHTGRAAAVPVFDTLQFACLVGFVATQGFLIPVVAIPGLNWAVWPSLPDLFGMALFFLVLVRRSPDGLSSFDRKLVWNLVLMQALLVANFLFVTIPVSSTGDGIRFGGFTLLLFAKFIAVFWAAAHVRLNARRMRVIHWAAAAALLWLIGTMWADRIGLVEIDGWTSHLRAGAGKWAAPQLNSTVGPNHGQTSVAILVIAAVVVMTGSKATGWFTEAWVLLFGGAATLASGSRQGLVRILTFVCVYLIPQPKRLALVCAVMLPIAGGFYWTTDRATWSDNDALQEALARQSVFLGDPLSNEGLSGRPDLWVSVIDTLNEKPIRWLVGYGMGNYVEFANAAHNMVLALLQDGGLVFLVSFTALWVRIAKGIWAIRHRAWSSVALFAALLSSSMTSGIFYPNLATGWYLGLFFVALHIEAGGKVYRPNASTPRRDATVAPPRTRPVPRVAARAITGAELESNE